MTPLHPPGTPLEASTSTTLIWEGFLIQGAVGSSAGNALAESFNATRKREVLQDAACWTDELTCRQQIFKWLVRYNTRRHHTWCGYLSPSIYEARRAATMRPPRNHTPCPRSGDRARAVP